MEEDRAEAYHHVCDGDFVPPEHEREHALQASDPPLLRAAEAHLAAR
jgi:hypothetical protein